MSEQVFLNESGVLVTNARVVAGAQTYAMASVTSSRVKTRSYGGAAGVLGALGMVSIGLIFVAERGAICGLTGVVLIALGVLFSRMGYSELFLGTAGGERAALRGKPEFIERVADAVTRAIISRG